MDVAKRPLTITVAYEQNGVAKEKDIEFSENVIRNHSYIYNITVKDENIIVLSYDVYAWQAVGSVTVPPFE